VCCPIAQEMAKAVNQNAQFMGEKIGQRAASTTSTNKVLCRFFHRDQELFGKRTDGPVASCAGAREASGQIVLRPC